MPPPYRRLLITRSTYCHETLSMIRGHISDCSVHIWRVYLKYVLRYEFPKLVCNLVKVREKPNGGIMLTIDWFVWYLWFIFANWLYPHVLTQYLAPLMWAHQRLFCTSNPIVTDVISVRLRSVWRIFCNILGNRAPSKSGQGLVHCDSKTI